jgi:predicted transcriptional regulator of viral defense system
MQTNESQGMQLLREMQLQGKFIFTIEEAIIVAKEHDIPRGQLNKILSSLVKRNLLLRLRRGLYAGFGSLPGQIHVHPFAIATHLIKPSAISHWSALQHHGLTEQVPQTVTATTPNKIVTPTMRAMHGKKLLPQEIKHAWEIAGIRYEYITIKNKYFFGIEKIWVDEYFLVPITDKERTLLDVFIFSKIFGGMGEALGILELAIPEIDIKKLVDYAIQYEKKSVIKRLGWALDYFGVSAKFFSPLQKIPVTHYSRLAPSEPPQGTYDKRWMIQNNLIKSEK